MLTGSGKYLENLVKSRLGVKVRSIELNVCQRCSSSMLSFTDQSEAVLAGNYAVQSAFQGETGKMVAFQRDQAAASKGTYLIKCTLEDVNEICNKEKMIPLNWITSDNCDVTEEFLSYATPLIQGEADVPKKDGRPIFAYRK